MKKIWFVKILYYLFFIIIFLAALIIFLEVTNFSFYNSYLKDFFYNTSNILNF